MDADKKLEAQEKFMEFNAAYETLSKIKAKRSKRNKEFQDDWGRRFICRSIKQNKKIRPDQIHFDRNPSKLSRDFSHLKSQFLSRHIPATSLSVSLFPSFVVL